MSTSCLGESRHRPPRSDSAVVSRKNGKTFRGCPSRAGAGSSNERNLDCDTALDLRAQVVEPMGDHLGTRISDDVLVGLGVRIAAYNVANRDAKYLACLGIQ